jgi:UDP-N-acetylglucosamine diphosphorylase/glucosamine-1-phosphate N-acetyltransferase
MIILYDFHCRENFLPLTYTRSAADMRCGILTMRERWEKISNTKVQTATIDYVQKLEPLHFSSEKNILIPANCFATEELFSQIQSLVEGQTLHTTAGSILCCNAKGAEDFLVNKNADAASNDVMEIDSISYSWDIFSKNDKAIRADFALLTKGRKSASISATNTIIGTDIFLEEGAIVEASILNASKGPIYIGKDAEIMEGSIVRGPLAMGEGAVLKLGTKIYGATTLGPGCKVGGEVNNSVFFANSSKAHDGFVGNSVIGEWCNIGADSNNSNLKNNYEEVKLWSEAKSTFVKTGLQFCGLIMADHSKCGINTMFNTGTVVGVSSNIFGAGFPRNFIPSFSWGGASGFTEYKTDKAFQTMKLVFARRNKELSDAEIEMYTHIFQLTQSQR